MKKLLAMLLALCMVFALCACGQTAAPAADPAPAQADPAPAAERQSTSRSGPTRSAAGAMLTPSMPSSPRSRRRTPASPSPWNISTTPTATTRSTPRSKAAPLPTSSWKGRNVSLPTGARRATWSISPTCGTPPTSPKSIRPASRPASPRTAPAMSTPSL